MKSLPRLREADITAEEVFFQRRKVLKAWVLPPPPSACRPRRTPTCSRFSAGMKAEKPPLDFARPAAWHAQAPLTPVDKVTGYNNFYEFGLDKADPAAHAGGLKTEGWQTRIDGEVAKPMTLDMADILKRFALEERIYRLRCVEAWSIVIPWIGFELNKLLKLVEPTGLARFVAFQTLDDPEQIPGEKDSFIGGDL